MLHNKQVKNNDSLVEFWLNRLGNLYNLYNTEQVTNSQFRRNPMRTCPPLSTCACTYVHEFICMSVGETCSRRLRPCTYMACVTREGGTLHSNPRRLRHHKLNSDSRSSRGIREKDELMNGSLSTVLPKA